MANFTKMKVPSSIMELVPFVKKLNEVLKRVIFGTLLITGFLILILMGPIMLILLVLSIQLSCFSEVINIGYNYNKMPAKLVYLRSLCWYFFGVTNYFFYVETVAPHFQNFYQKFALLKCLVTYHRFVSFCLYLVGMILFVISLVRKRDLIAKQFRILAWTHTLLIIVVLQSYMLIDNIFQGLIWAVLPASLVILNDIFAYVFGRLYGKTPLIELSPKKTWEGFIGGAISTCLSGFILSHVMCKFQYFICPVEFLDCGITVNSDCERNHLFVPERYEVGPFSLAYYPFTVHFLSFALFASIIAPFGGFCASGFKRAFKIKDFSDVIPGHGGIMDRFDCQFLMATFVNVYIFTFIRRPSVDLLFQKILYLNERDQVDFYYSLKSSLEPNLLSV